MPTYTPPLRDLRFVMEELLDIESTFKSLPAHADTDLDTVMAILEEGGKFASEVIFPLNQSGDREGCTHDKTNFTVKAPKGFKEAYKQYVEGGWAAHRKSSVLRNAQQRQSGVDDVSRPHARRVRMLARTRHARAEGDLLAEDYKR
jgi:hypothetical protein